MWEKGPKIKKADTHFPQQSDCNNHDNETYFMILCSILISRKMECIKNLKSDRVQSEH